LPRARRCSPSPVRAAKPRGRYRLDALIARHGAEAGARVIVPELTADCPQRDAAALVERRDILFPDRTLFPASDRAVSVYQPKSRAIATNLGAS
jgi:hypothetical protein